MGLLKLNFLPKSNFVSNDPIENILHKYGQDLCDYAKGYFTYIVTTGSSDFSNPHVYSLYILVPEIGYTYQILTVNIKNVAQASVTYFALKTEQSETVDVEIDQIRGNYPHLDAMIKLRLESGLANQTYQFFVHQVDLKRETRKEKFDDDIEK